MRTFLKFLTKIKGFWKFYKDYEYGGETVRFIIENYQDILQNRTKLMSKPTYYSNDVIKQIDEWYEENPEYAKGIKSLEALGEIEQLLEMEIYNTERRMKNPCVAFWGIEVSEWQANGLSKSYIKFCNDILKIIEKSGE